LIYIDPTGYVAEEEGTEGGNDEKDDSTFDGGAWGCVPNDDGSVTVVGRKNGQVIGYTVACNNCVGAVNSLNGLSRSSSNESTASSSGSAGSTAPGDTDGGEGGYGVPSNGADAISVAYSPFDFLSIGKSFGSLAAIGIRAGVRGLATKTVGNLNGMPLKEAKQLMSKWDKATFDTLSDSIRDHAKRHGFGLDIAKYLRKAARFNKKGAKKTILEKGATRWNRKNGEFLIERNGKIVTYGVN
jgi:hypothetical protein